MKKALLLLSTAGFIAAMVSCHKNTTLPSGTTYLDLPSTPYEYFSNLTGASPATNNKATLGRVLFYDGHLSLNNAISCASCHKQAYGFADNATFSTGYEAKKTVRNSKSISNLFGDLSFSPVMLNEAIQPFFWDGRESILSNLSNKPITNHIEMGMDDPEKIPSKLSGISYYPDLFLKAYGDANITSDRISECLATFMASINSNNSRFNTGNLNELETQGMSLFKSKYDCAKCHQIETNFYGQDSTTFRNIGLDAVPTDAGRGAITMNPNDNGKFRVPNLHNVALTAPYMHDGRFKTLDEVIDHYSHGIQNSRNLDPLLKDKMDASKPLSMNISADEKKALIAFLNSMTDYSMITDPKFSNPFKTK